MTILEVHKSKILRDIQEVLMEDIKTTIDIINERVDLPATAYIYDDIIELESIVTGREGLYPIFKVELLVTSNLTPVLYLTTIGEDCTTYDFSLSSVNLKELMELKSISKRRYRKEKRDVIMNMTQTYRVDLSDVVSDLFEHIYNRYEFCGKLNRKRQGLL